MKLTISDKVHGKQEIDIEKTPEGYHIELCNSIADFKVVDGKIKSKIHKYNKDKHCDSVKAKWEINKFLLRNYVKIFDGMQKQLDKESKKGDK